MQSSKAVQLPATSGCVVHAAPWKPAMELLKKPSGHFFKAQTGTTTLCLLRAVLLGSCWGLAAPGLPAAPGCRGCGAGPEHPVLGCTSLCHRVWQWPVALWALHPSSHRSTAGQGVRWMGLFPSCGLAVPSFQD